MSRNEAFYRVPTVSARVSAGEVELPIRYRDADSVSVVYRVSAERALHLLEPAGLVPVVFGQSRALAVITWFAYRDTSIGPYNELSIALLACHPLDRPRSPWLGLFSRNKAVGVHILHLPVTTEIACAGGRELWGYPKFVAELPFERTRRLAHAALIHQGKRVFEMRMPLGRGAALPLPDLSTLSALDGRLLHTRIATDCRGRFARARGVELSIHDPSHPVARTLEALGLSEPLLTLDVSPFRSLLPLGLPVANLPAPRVERPRSDSELRSRAS